MGRVSVHVDSGRAWRGGQAQVLHLLRGLHAAGERPLLVAPAGSPLVVRAAEESLTVAPTPLRGEWDAASVVQLARLLRTVGADVIHAHTAHAGIERRLARNHGRCLLSSASR